MTVDITRALKAAATSGDVRIGLAETKKSLAKGEAKMIVVAKNCPERNELSAAKGVRVLEFSGSNIELGAACGKPYPISALAIVSPGESNILSA